MKVSVVIVSYNVKYYLEQCLDSLWKALSNVSAEVIVVDNCSKDDTVDYLKPKFPNTKFIKNKKNLGFSKANNVAIRQSVGEYVLLLNPDTIVGRDTIKTALRFMDARPKAGALGVNMLTDTGLSAPESRRGLPTPLTAFYKMVGLGRMFPHSRHFSHYYMGGLSWTKPGKIEVISGAFCFIRRAALDKVGLLDEDFFMYGEDIDLSYRLLQGGFENWYLPARILHYKGESTHRTSFRYVYVFYKAMLIFVKKHYSGWKSLLSIPLRLAVIVKAITAFGHNMMRLSTRILGGRNQKQEDRARYVFIGNENSCNALKVKMKGVKLKFVKGDMETLPSGHLSAGLPKQDTAQETYFIYDLEAYSYTDILSIFALRPNKCWHLATYSMKTGKMISFKKVI